MKVDAEHLKSISGVEQVLPIMKPYKLASREFHKDDTVIEIPCPQGGTVKVRGQPLHGDRRAVRVGRG